MSRNFNSRNTRKSGRTLSKVERQLQEEENQRVQQEKTKKHQNWLIAQQKYKKQSRTVFIQYPTATSQSQKQKKHPPTQMKPRNLLAELLEQEEKEDDDRRGDGLSAFTRQDKERHDYRTALAALAAPSVVDLEQEFPSLPTKQNQKNTTTQHSTTWSNLGSVNLAKELSFSSRNGDAKKAPPPPPPLPEQNTQTKISTDLMWDAARWMDEDNDYDESDSDDSVTVIDDLCIWKKRQKKISWAEIEDSDSEDED